MKRILFFETPEFTGATRVTRTFSKKIKGKFDTRVVKINSLENAKCQIEKALQKETPDILFSSFSVINPEVILAGKEKGLKVVIRQDYKLQDLNSELRRKLFETYPKADWVVVQTSEMKKELLSNMVLNERKIKVVENPLDEEYILQQASGSNPFPDYGRFHFLWVGRTDPIKDLPTLKKAFETVHIHYPNTDLTLVSGIPNPYPWIKNADCLVISSISEASPNVLKEALFLETIVVSTDCSPVVRMYLPPERIASVGNVGELSKAMERVVLDTLNNM